MSIFKRTQRKYVKKAYRVRNWREYESGLRNRGSLTVWISLTAGKLVNWDAPRPRRRKPGRQRKYSNHAIETAVTLVGCSPAPMRAGRPCAAVSAPSASDERCDSRLPHRRRRRRMRCQLLADEMGLSLCPTSDATRDESRALLLVSSPATTSPLCSSTHRWSLR